MSEPQPPAPFSAESAACRAAQSAWAGVPVRDRLKPVRALRRLIAGERQRLIDAVTADLPRLPHEVIVSDLLPTAAACRFLERNAVRLLRPTPVPNAERPTWLLGERDTVHRRPLGVVGIIGTWNYPVFLNGVQIAQALAAGNGVLWKPSELAATSARVWHELLGEAGFPANLVQLLPAARDAGARLVESDIDHLVFTGSADVGRRIARRLGERLVPSTLELSGCDAMVVRADADAELAARAAWFAATLNKGQTCIAVRRALVDAAVYEKFVETLRPLAEAAEPVPLALPAQADQARRLIADAVSKGAERVGSGPGGASGEARARPSLVVGATPDMAVCREATFAPVLAVLRTSGDEDALAQNAACPFALGASIFTPDAVAAGRIAARLPVGMVAVNDAVVPAAHPATPFGGRRDSGWGATQGADGLLAMTAPQAVGAKSGRFRPHYDTPDGTPDAGLAGMAEGLLRASHGAGLREWAGGLWQALRGMVRRGRG